MVEVDHLTFKYLTINEDDQTDVTKNVQVPSQLNLLAKYAMDLCIVEDKELHFAFFINNQLVVKDI